MLNTSGTVWPLGSRKKNPTTCCGSGNITGFSLVYSAIYDRYLFVLILIKVMHLVFVRVLLGPSYLDITNIINISKFKSKTFTVNYNLTN